MKSKIEEILYKHSERIGLYEGGVITCVDENEFEEIAQELYRITKQGGVVVWVVSDATTNGTESGTSFRQALFFKECGFNLHDTMIYHKHSPPLTHNRYEQQKVDPANHDVRRVRQNDVRIAYVQRCANGH